ncbi:MAG: LysM peptidoglycan-binding domain-containing protein [Chlamydiales bacterium]|nr:LysM peptidoglycan-binding domain-containing protein [Chlamydiales bacterium]NCF70880.1 LysM peptidoglycan-binding domain-containing protein [Chlamydiales bacterium]
MNHKFKFLNIFILAGLTGILCQCNRQPYIPKEDYVTMEQIYARVEDNQYELSHNQAELDTITQRIQDQQTSMYQLNQKLDLLFNEYSDLSDTQQVTLRERIAELEKANRQLLKDLDRVKTHANTVTQSVNELYHQVSQTNSLKSSVDDLYHVVMKIKGKPTYFKPFSYYTVKSGDSLESIALRNQVDTEELKLFNNLSKSAVFVGQQIRIPKG